MKLCPSCNTEKAESEFAHRAASRDGLQYQCKVCDRAKHAIKYREQQPLDRRIPETKLCTRCHKIKPAAEFHRHSKRIDGLQNYCKECKSVVQDVGYADGSLQAYHRERYAASGGAYHAKYYLDNKTKISSAGAVRRRLEPWRHIISNIRGRAEREGIPYDIDVEWGSETYTGRCEVTGIAFIKTDGNDGQMPFSPSIDRIVPALGYTKGNCRWVLFGINALKGSGTDADMWRIIMAAASQRMLIAFQKETPPEGGASA